VNASIEIEAKRIIKGILTELDESQLITEDLIRNKISHFCLTSDIDERVYSFLAQYDYKSLVGLTVENALELIQKELSKSNEMLFPFNTQEILDINTSDISEFRYKF
jgi:hypothetical protein